MSYNPPTVTLATPNFYEAETKKDSAIFKTTSILATCDSCKTTANTTVNTKFSIVNYLLYCIADPLVWLIYMLVKGKDLNCCDATHTCSGCGSLIATYSAC